MAVFPVERERYIQAFVRTGQAILVLFFSLEREARR